MIITTLFRYTNTPKENKKVRFGDFNGAQIDLLIDRRDRVVSICEMKYSVNEFTIDKTYDMNLRNKMESFRKATNCKKSIQLVMVTTYGVKPGKYSGVVNAEVTLDDLFR